MPFTYIQGTVKAQTADDASVAVFAISYSSDGKQIYRRRLGVLDAVRPRLDFSFAPHPDARVFDIALYMSASQYHGKVVLNQWHLENRAHKV